MGIKNEKEIKERYGNLLDKYLEPGLAEHRQRSQREEEAKTRYGGILEKGKDSYNRHLDEMQDRVNRLEDEKIKRREEQEQSAYIASLYTKERIKMLQKEEEDSYARLMDKVQNVLAKKQARVDAEEKKRAEERRAAESEQRMYDRIDGLIRINPKLAEDVIQIHKKNGIL